MSNKLIVVLGPTASGKTAFSVQCALRLRSGQSATPIEIINADSRQLYKYMDIGTAKIQPQDMRGIPHHLLSVVDPESQVTIGWYQKEAMRVIDDVHSRGVIPLLVGGSMLYISSIIDGLEPDPHRRSGGPPSKIKHPCPYDLYIIGMQVSRPELCRRIAERTKNLLQSGWVEEVRRLLTMGYTVDDPGLMACGYREIAGAIRSFETPRPLHARSSGSKTAALRLSNRSYGDNGAPPVRGPEPLRAEWQNDTSALCEKISAKTRQYAKRQMTWWRHDKRIRWINPAADLSQSVAEELQGFLACASPRSGVL